MRARRTKAYIPLPIPGLPKRTFKLGIMHHALLVKRKKIGSPYHIQPSLAVTTVFSLRSYLLQAVEACISNESVENVCTLTDPSLFSIHALIDALLSAEPDPPLASTGTRHRTGIIDQ